MSTEGFFEESQEQSRIKSAIVAKYFSAWAKVILPRTRTRPKRVAYVDLFAGPGRYEDGTTSTPILVLETAIKDPELAKTLVTIFNDKDEAHCRSLETEIGRIPGIERLQYKPVVWNDEVGDKIVGAFEAARLVPTLCFIDPWGYKGLSLRLVNSVLKDWGCDCIFFFNYTRINMGVGNEWIQEHIDALFGPERAASLRTRLESMRPSEREEGILEELTSALRDLGGQYVLPFRFRNETGTRTKHHLIFVSKNVLAYTIMKDIMASASSRTDQGVPSFEYNPDDERSPLLFEMTGPMGNLEEMLPRAYAGKTLSVRQVFEGHHVGRPFVLANYKEALRRLEDKGAVVADPPAAKRRKIKEQVTMADTVVIRFPTIEGA